MARARCFISKPRPGQLGTTPAVRLSHAIAAGAKIPQQQTRLGCHAIRARPSGSNFAAVNEPGVDERRPRPLDAGLPGASQDGQARGLPEAASKHGSRYRTLRQKGGTVRRPSPKQS